MAEFEVKLSADTAEATSAVGGFRKEYQDLVKAIQKPLRQIDALQKTTENAKAATSAYFEARRRVDDLKRAIEQAGQPVRELDRAYAKAQRTLASATSEFDRQKAKVREQRAELKAAGVDVRNLAAEQQRLQSSLVGAMGQGQADAAITRALDTFGVSRLRALREQLVTLRTDYQRLARSGQMSATERIAAENRYQAALLRTQQQIKELTAGEDAGSGGVAAITARIAAITAAAYTLQRIAGFYFSAADAVGELEDRMRNALPVQEQYTLAQSRLEDISRRVRIPIEQTSELFLRAVGPLQEMGFSAAQTTDLVGALSAGLVANSVKGERAAAVINQFTKGLQTGVIRGDAFNAILENSTALTDALQKGLGVSRSELIRLANAGELTTERVVTAFASQSESLLGLADAMRVTGADAAGTFSQSVDKLIGAIDKITGASAAATEQLDKVSDAISDVADGKNSRALELLGNALLAGGKGLGTLLPGAGAFASAADAYWKFSNDATDALENLTDAEGLARTESEIIEERRLAAFRTYAAEFGKEQESLTNAFKTAVNDQVAAQNRANAKLKKAQDAQLETTKRYRDALQKLGAGAIGPDSFGNASALRVAAAQALSAGDAERAKKLAQQSLEMLMKLAEAGENTYGFEGFIKGLQGIEEAADKAILASAEAARKAEIDKVRELKKEFEDLKNFKLSPTIDDAALAEETEKMKRWAAMIGESFVIRPRTSPVSETSSTEWHAPMLPPGSTPPSTTAPVSAPVKPSGIVQDAATEAALPPVKAPVAPVTIRQDGPNSWTNLPAAEVEITPKGVREAGPNSFTNLPAVEVDVLPKGIRQDGQSSFTNLPVDADIVVKSVAAQDSEIPVVPALLRPLGPSPDAPPVSVESKLDEVSKSDVLQEFGAFIEQLKKMSVVPLTLSMVTAIGGAGEVPGYYGGGYTGPGGLYEPAGVVHRGEVVWSQFDIARAGGVAVVEAMRRGLRGYSTGGIVAPRTLPSIPVLAPALQQQLDGPSFPDFGTVQLGVGNDTLEVLMRRDSFEKTVRRAATKFGRTQR
ncbi:tape measure protein [Pseudomonas indica]|uniref:Tape measure domain-containing protein n=1 Tax=Pseudomonas indica TaxID=137658 RepID=A0A1G8V6D0_9PSED|nr:tape measure protein [Pseudomonas indica]SDJ61414.1 tape measure domain-containing protein [Pseudomonas indica]